MGGTLILAILTVFVGTEKGFILTGTADLGGWAASGEVRIGAPEFLEGVVGDLIDGNRATFVRCDVTGGPVALRFDFARPVLVKQLGLQLSAGGVARWRAWGIPPSRESERPSAHETLIPLFDGRDLEGEIRDLRAFPRARVWSSIRIEIESVTAGPEILLREFELTTNLDIEALEVTRLPGHLRLGRAYSPLPLARDGRGGRLPLDQGVRWIPSPPELLDFRAGRLMPRRTGTARLAFAFGNLRSPDLPIRIVPLAPPPRDLRIEVFHDSVSLAFTAPTPSCPAYAVHHRRDGEPWPKEPATVTDRTVATVNGLDPGRAYHFSVIGVDDRTLPITSRSESIRCRLITPSAGSTVTATRVRLFVPVYRSGFSADSLKGILEGIEAARVFYYRHTRGRLVLETEPLLIKDAPSIPRAPGLDEPLLALRRSGRLDRPFDAIHVIGGHLAQNVGGHLMPEGRTGSMGHTARAPFPRPWRDLVAGHAEGDERFRHRASVAWTLTHEFFHHLETVIPEGAVKNIHFLENYPLPKDVVFDIGDHFDGLAAVLRGYPGWRELPRPFAGRIVARDTDGDGLPDRDPRFPTDEYRFGSDPLKIDSDGDGLTDLDEFRAGLFRGTDPTRTDTDGDGRPDAVDPHPLADFSEEIPRGTPRPGEPPPHRLCSGPLVDGTERDEPVRIHAAWDENFLYLVISSEPRLDARIEIDGSGRYGVFESDRRIPEPEADDDTSGEETFRTSRGDVFANEAALTVHFGDGRLYKGGVPVPEARVLSLERSRRKILWIAVPGNLGPGSSRCHVRKDALPGRGLELTPGRILGFRFECYPSGTRFPSRDPGVSLFEPCRFHDARLAP